MEQHLSSAGQHLSSAEQELRLGLMCGTVRHHYHYLSALTTHKSYETALITHSLWFMPELKISPLVHSLEDTNSDPSQIQTPPKITILGLYDVVLYVVLSLKNTAESRKNHHREVP